MFTVNMIVKALAPFNFDLSAEIFSRGDPQVRSYVNGHFTQVLRIDEKLALAILTSTGTVNQPEMHLELKSNSTISPEEKQKAQAIVKYIFNLDFPLSSFYQDVREDAKMLEITQKLYGLKNPTTPTVFEALVDSIIEQQISIKVAVNIETKIAKRFGETLNIDGLTYYAFPTPQTLANASTDEIRQVGLSQRKAEYIKQAAELIVEGKLDLEHLKNHKNSEQIIAELDEIRGIGVWTAELTMLRGIQKLDALPADDFGIRRVISKYYCNGKPIKTAEAREIAKAWGRWKGLAAYYLIVAEIRGL